ncbi:MAG: HNH endonuclease [Rhodanobacter sp.]|nr:MAG: HNH endonuclease [Rhodanobacter sp.]TAM09925.1 MAG: HNH endonuclease [Rhodanobacter sp.]TAM34257.1 MAG: HNH endonuclease [Rhodanobacter sp.]
MPLPTLAAKALADAGYDLVDAVDGSWFRAHVSGGAPGEVWIAEVQPGFLLAVGQPGTVQRLGLESVVVAPPAPAAEVGQADTPEHLFRALHALHALQANPVEALKRELGARLARLDATERTRKVRERIGQDLYRGALMQFWGGRCALTGIELPPGLLRASHAKPWADASDDERLDPFNGLLLTVRYDVLFDQGWISFDDAGKLLASPALDAPMRSFLGLVPGMALRFVLPGHVPYLHYHREHIARS